MLTKEQRQAAITQATLYYPDMEHGVDVIADTPDGFDEVEDGVWVRCWIKVRARDIPNYRMEPPAPSSTVSVTG